MKTPRRKICVVTGTRAEYGILYPLLKALHGETSVQLQLIVTGAHLSAAHGNTYQEIERDGFVITKRIEILSTDDTPAACTKSSGLAMIGFAEAFTELKPNLLIALGDRYEMHAAVTSSVLMGIPICHIAGGELTEGAFDDALRHSMSKMSSLHFTTHDSYRQRLIQMGAVPSSVITTGSLAIDNIRNDKLLSREELEWHLNFKLTEKLLVLTYHPETRNLESPLVALEEILRALDRHKDFSVVITEANADPGSKAINCRLNEFAKARPNNVKIVSSLGRLRFLSILQFACAVIGNSSSGISEAPAFGIGTINIGNRQKGRLMPPSVVSVPANVDEISRAIALMTTDDFKRQAHGSMSFYGDGNAAARMIEVLRSPDLPSRLSNAFYDISANGGLNS